MELSLKERKQAHFVICKLYLKHGIKGIKGSKTKPPLFTIAREVFGLTNSEAAACYSAAIHFLNAVKRRDMMRSGLQRRKKAA